jgi:hypothetical protein
MKSALVRSSLMFTGLLAVGVLSLPVAGRADTPTTHRVHKVKKQQPPPPLPSGTQGPVPQVPLDAIPAVAPQVNFQDGLLTIVAPNSTLSEILRSVRKHTSADIDIPAAAGSERVVTRLGPGPVRDVMAELLNGSHFNYILLGSADNANALVRVVLVAKTGPDNPAPATEAGNPAQPAEVAAETPEPDAQEDNSDDNQDQAAAEAEQQQQQQPADQPGVRTPQQMLQEMQQRQVQMQQQQMQQQQQQPGQPPVAYPGRPGVIPVPQPPQQQ